MTDNASPPTKEKRGWMKTDGERDSSTSSQRTTLAFLLRRKWRKTLKFLSTGCYSGKLWTCSDCRRVWTHLLCSLHLQCTASICSSCSLCSAERPTVPPSGVAENCALALSLFKTPEVDPGSWRTAKPERVEKFPLSSGTSVCSCGIYQSVSR